MKSASRPERPGLLLAPTAKVVPRRGLLRLTLTRRGVRHGVVTLLEEPPASPPDEDARWQAARPILLRGILHDRLPPYRQACARTLAWFERWRAGARFQSWVLRRLRAAPGFVAAGSTVDLGDEREIEKVFVHRVAGRRIVAADLYAKLAWIAHDERDASLRLRFSVGSEQLTEWYREPRRSVWADRYAAALFPECEVIAGCRPLLARIGRHCGQRVRLSERIVYNNVPGGGAVFHHDAEPTQLGVCFGQLVGETVWLAIAGRELAAEVSAVWGCSRRQAAAVLRATDEPRLHRLLNHSARFTARLARAGAMFVVRAGDVILLPTIPGRDTCWHSVFGVGRGPSLAHSYGVFGVGVKT